MCSNKKVDVKHDTRVTMQDQKYDTNTIEIAVLLCHSIDFSLKIVIPAFPPQCASSVDKLTQLYTSITRTKTLCSHIDEYIEANYSLTQFYWSWALDLRLLPESILLIWELLLPNKCHVIWGNFIAMYFKIYHFLTYCGYSFPV